MFLLTFLLFWLGQSHASPLHTELAPRDNAYNLKCSNAPNITAGTYVIDPNLPPQKSLTQTDFDPNRPLTEADVLYPLALPASGSSDPWMTYLWCTPGTKTYTFFSNGRLIPPPLTYHSVQGALQGAIMAVQDWIVQHGDGPIQSRPEDAKMGISGEWYMTPPNWNMQVFARSQKGVLTYGILGAALLGLQQYVLSGYDRSNDPLVFQINDGKWGEVGIGYVGYVDPSDKQNCVYRSEMGTNFPCQDVAAGKVIS